MIFHPYNQTMQSKTRHTTNSTDNHKNNILDTCEYACAVEQNGIKVGKNVESKTQNMLMKYEARKIEYRVGVEFACVMTI